MTHEKGPSRRRVSFISRMTKRREEGRASRTVSTNGREMKASTLEKGKKKRQKPTAEPTTKKGRGGTSSKTSSETHEGKQNSGDPKEAR